MPASYARHNGVWKPVKEAYGHHSGVWKPSKQVLARDANVWKPVYAPALTSAFIQGGTTPVDGSYIGSTLNLSAYPGSVIIIVSVISRTGNYPTQVRLSGTDMTLRVRTSGSSLYLAMYSLKTTGGVNRQLDLRWGVGQGFMGRSVWVLPTGNLINENPIASVSGLQVLNIPVHQGGTVFATGLRSINSAVTPSGLSVVDQGQGEGGSHPAYIRSGRVTNATDGTANINFGPVNICAGLSFR